MRGRARQTAAATVVALGVLEALGAGGVRERTAAAQTPGRAPGAGRTSRSADVTLEAPEGCPGADELADRIARRKPRAAADAPARVRVEPTNRGFVARVTMGTGERTLEAPTCADAVEAVAVVLALARGGVAEAEPADAEPPAGARDATPAPATEPARPPPPRATPARPEAAPAVGFRLGAGLAVDGASVPAPTPGATLSVELRPGPFALGLTLGGFLRQTERFGGSGQVRVGLADALVVGCWLPRFGALEGGPCLGAGVGVLFGSSAGVSRPASGLGPRPEGLAGGRLGLRLAEGVALRLDAGALVDPVRFPFRVANVGDVFRPPPVTLRAGLGVEAVFR